MANKVERRAWWQKVVQAYGRSTLTQAAFCQQHGISRKSLHRWRVRLAVEPRREALPLVVEVVLDDEPAPSTFEPDRDIELLVGGDCSLFFAPGTAPDYVADLVVALRRRGAC